MTFFYPSLLLLSKAGLKSGVFNPKTAHDKANLFYPKTKPKQDDGISFTRMAI